ncbi:MAG: hypothetical protein NT007_10640 [Candidatus Kapabacteria bacterium]|nr:hypothetical protein [Candidatus Kapabacteria bacterium]
MKYEEKDIDQLLNCEKEFVEPPQREYKEDRGHCKMNFSMKSIEGNYQFRGFIRYNLKFPEIFSVGLDYNPREEKGTICLLRCNGSHGENKQLPHHESFHIHRANADTINSGQRLESNLEITNSYASLEQAIQFYFHFINLKFDEKNKYFPEKPLKLFD